MVISGDFEVIAKWFIKSQLLGNGPFSQIA